VIYALRLVMSTVTKWTRFRWTRHRRNTVCCG